MACNMPPAALDRHHPVPTEDVAGRRPAGQVPARMPLMHWRQELLAAPGRVATPRVQDRVHDLLGCLTRRAPRRRERSSRPGGAVAQMTVDSKACGGPNGNMGYPEPALP